MSLLLSECTSVQNVALSFQQLCVYVCVCAFVCACVLLFQIVRFTLVLIKTMCVKSVVRIITLLLLNYSHEQKQRAVCNIKSVDL